MKRFIAVCIAVVLFIIIWGIYEYNRPQTITRTIVHDDTFELIFSGGSVTMEGFVPTE